MKKLNKRSNAGQHSVSQYACSCSCWCWFFFTVDENMTNTFNAAR